MQPPKIYFISKNLSPEDLQRSKEILLLTPLAAVVLTDPRDADFAKQIGYDVTTLQQPIAIVADFEDRLTAVDENGSLCPLL